MSSRRTPYWSRNLVIILIMLVLWAGVTVGVVWFAPSFRGTGRAYWLAAYGAPLFYLALVGLYAILMRRRAPPD